MNWRCRVFSGFLARAIFRENSVLLNFKNCRCYCKTLMNSFPWSVLLSTIERTSKCSKRFSKTTRLRLVSLNILTSSGAFGRIEMLTRFRKRWAITNFLEVICQKIKLWACLFPKLYSRGKPHIIFSLWFTLQIFLWVVVQCILFLSWPRRG